MSMEIIFKIKKEIWVIFGAGLILLIVASFLNPDLNQQIFDILTLFGVFLMLIPVILVTLNYLQKSRTKQ